MGIGPSELILILIVALFLFGPDKIPEIARSMGKAMGEFKKAQTQAENEIKNEIQKFDTPVNEKDVKIHNLAIEMGIDVNNKTIEQLVEEIRSKIRTNEVFPVKTAGV
jgi:sec-independent protein translocase protein TatA